MQDKITALIPTYKRPKYLRRAILSVLRQTHRNLQISIFDNASGDNTESVVDELSRNDKRIEYHCHKENIGASRNFKYAFNSVETPYFSVISDDDFLALDFYENAVNVLSNNSDVMFVVLNTLIVDEHASLIGDCVSTNSLTFYRDKDRFDILHSGAIPLTWTAMVFRKELAQIYADMDDRYDVAADMRFLLHSAARYNFAHLSKVGAFLTYHAGSFSLSRKTFDYVHQGVQVSRYIEIIHDKNVPEYIRNRSAYYLNKLFINGFYRQELMPALKRLIKNCCNETNLNSDLVKNDIKNSKYAGFVKTSAFLNFLYQNQFFRNIVNALFGGYYKKRKSRFQYKMSMLQNGRYKKLFQDIKEINS